ncbi:unnamed protein product [Leptidea sinapis]|uniref:Uncharacterized protein n=1 Tax=Leptidea sinapis TaxID=189913 RepID=A0A5E4QYR5_9NEOP|nr:unnamed protein product [Leptidea sinapis]
MLTVLDRSRQLKLDMCKLNQAYLDVIVERDEFQKTVSKFDECCIEYEQTLKRTSLLEQELCEAHSQISCLEAAKLDLTAVQNQSLFDELVSVTHEHMNWFLT